MYRITRSIDLSDPAATLGDQASEVSHVHLVHTIGGVGEFVVITLRNHEAALIPLGRLSLTGDPDGARACESLRRWLKGQDIPLSLASLRFTTPETYADMVGARAFAVICLADTHRDPELEARFLEWQACKPMTGRLVRTA